MKMEKIAVMLLAGSLTVSMGATAFASSVSTPINEEAQIKATYNEDTQVPEVYYVDVQWGNLEYTYKSGTSRSWNSDNLKFEETNGIPEWTCADGADQIKVINHSNTGVTAYFSYEEKNNSGISGSFSNPFVGLVAPTENSAFDNAPSGSTALTLSGALSSNTTDKSAVGGVTVTIQDGAVAAITNQHNILIYATDNPGIYKATYQSAVYGISITFTINGIKYSAKRDNTLEKNGNNYGIEVSPNYTYEFEFNTNDLTYTKKAWKTE